MSAQSPQQIRKVFVFGAAAVLGLFILVQSLLAIESSGPRARIKELMPAIGAQLAERPLSAEQAGFRLERSPADGGGLVTPLAELPEGHVVFVNFWATWCEPCVRELPSMIELLRKMRGRPFRMVAISYDESWEEITKFFKRVFGGIPRELTIYRDPNASGEDEAMLRLSFGTRKLPETYVVRDGRVLARFVNERNWVDEHIVEYFERLTEVR